VSGTLRKRIISCVVDKPGLKGTDIAGYLGISKKEANAILYKVSSDILFHDKYFCWYSSQEGECKERDAERKENNEELPFSLIVQESKQSCEKLTLDSSKVSLGQVRLMSSPSDELKKVLSQSFDYPFQSIKDYIESDKKLAKKKLFLIDGMTPKLSRELDRLIHLIFTSIEFRKLSFLQMLDLIRPSPRLKRAIINKTEEGSFHFLNIGEFLDMGVAGLETLYSLPNVGEKSVNNFVSMLNEAQLQSKLAPYEVEPIKKLKAFLCDSLTDKEYDILARRLGEKARKGETLEKIGSDYGVTRERIRQIESKAIKKLRSSRNIGVLEQYLDQLDEQITSLVMNDKKIILCEQVEQVEQYLFMSLPSCKLLITVVYEGLEGWFNANYRRVIHKQELIGWISYKLPKKEVQKFGSWMLKNAVQDYRWDELLLTTIYDSKWPINTYTLSRKVLNLSQDDIENIMKKKFKAKIENGIVKNMGALSAVHRVKYILRDATKGLHTSDIRLRHLEMFGEDLSEHAIGSTLGRMREALIVERGVYDLYENLELTHDEVKHIANEIFNYIEDKSCYVSMKIIYKALFCDKSKYLGKMKEYMVLGITQDDSRFSIKRGGMIGLNSKDFEAIFVSLYDAVYKIMDEYGPMSVRKMQEYLYEKTHRDILTVTINMIFKEKDSNSYIAVEDGVYDLMVKFFRSEKYKNKVRYAIELALLDNPITAFHLMEKLHAVGIDLNIYNIYSFCSKLDNISISNYALSLEEVSDEVCEYNKAYKTMVETCDSIDEIKIILKREFFGIFVEVDGRLSKGAMSKLELETKEQTDLLDQLVEEFNF